jgi:hypothetical protein
MIKDIDKEIAKLLKIKEEINNINNLKNSVDKLEVMSQARYNFLASKNLLKSDVLYYIADLEVKPYIEGFSG